MKGVKMETKTVSANTLDELNKIVQDIIAQGWQAEGGPVKNADGTLTQKMIKNK